MVLGHLGDIQNNLVHLRDERLTCSTHTSTGHVKRVGSGRYPVKESSPLKEEVVC